jgi:hypothetical protein
MNVIPLRVTTSRYPPKLIPLEDGTTLTAFHVGSLNYIWIYIATSANIASVKEIKDSCTFEFPASLPAPNSRVATPGLLLNYEAMPLLNVNGEKPIFSVKHAT